MLKLNEKEEYNLTIAMAEISMITEDVNGWLYYGTTSDLRAGLKELNDNGMSYDLSAIDDDSSSDEHIFYIDDSNGDSTINSYDLTENDFYYFKKALKNVGVLHNTMVQRALDVIATYCEEEA